MSSAWVNQQLRCINMSFVTQMFNIHLHNQPLWPQALVSATPPLLPVNNVLKKILEGPLGEQAWSLQGPEGRSDSRPAPRYSCLTPDVTPAPIPGPLFQAGRKPFPLRAGRPCGSPVVTWVALNLHLPFSRDSFCYKMLAISLAPLFSVLTYTSLPLLSLDY